MRYIKGKTWTPVPFIERVRRAGWSLLFPPVWTLTCFALVMGGLKLFFFVFPGLKGRPHSEPWLFILITALLLLTIGIQEADIINREYASFEEMVSTRLFRLEEASRRNPEK